MPSEREIDNYIDKMEEENIIYVDKELEYAEKYHKIEEQLGCPLEVRCKVFYNSTIYNCLGYKMTVKETYDDHFIAVIENDVFSFDYKDYKQTWWLKKDKSE